MPKFEFDFKRFASEAKRSIDQGVYGSKRRAYESTFLNASRWGHLSNGVVEFDDGTDREIRKNARISLYSLPFRLEGKWKRALKNYKPLVDYDPAYPHVILGMDEGTNLRGDEVIMVEARGALEKYFKKARFVTWRLYEPGEYEFNEFAGGNGKRVAVNARDLTAAHVVSMLTQKFSDASEGKVTIAPEMVYDCLGLLMKKSDSLKDRWRILDGRMQCQIHVMKYPEVSSVVFYSMAPIAQPDFAEFINDMREGKLKSWSDIMVRLDKVGKLNVDPRVGSVLAALFYQGLNLNAGVDVVSEVQEFPTSAVVSIPGLTFFNTIMKGYDERVQLLVDGVAQKSLESQEKAILYLQKLQQVKIDGWTAALSALDEGLGTLKPAVRDQVLNQVLALQNSMESMITADAGRRLGDTGAVEKVLDGLDNVRVDSRIIEDSGKDGSFAPNPTFGDKT